MARNHQEYARDRKGWGAWNYSTNKENLDRFFREGIERMKGTDDIVTIGMRGDGDEAMGNSTDTKLLENIIDNQRRIIKEVTKRPAKETPQIWALYKEVQDYYAYCSAMTTGVMYADCQPLRNRNVKAVGASTIMWTTWAHPVTPSGSTSPRHRTCGNSCSWPTTAASRNSGS